MAAEDSPPGRLSDRGDDKLLAHLRHFRIRSRAIDELVDSPWNVSASQRTSCHASHVVVGVPLSLVEQYPGGCLCLAKHVIP